LLYTWGAANIGTATTEFVNAFPNKTSDRQGICPEGWAIPSDYDWNQLEKEIAIHPIRYSSEQTPFPWNPLYEATADWRPSSGSASAAWWGRSMKANTKVTGNNIAATNGVSLENGVGFNLLLVGGLDGGAAYAYGTGARLWSGSTVSATVVWRRQLDGGGSGVVRGTVNKYASQSVRCKKIDYVIN
jgi:uncharacterized protein (TIGR02145 family)